MKVKALIDCVGVGYNLKAGEIGEVTPTVAELLISFSYVEEVKPKPKKVAK